MRNVTLQPEYRPHTEKARGLLRMAAAGLRIPSTIISSATDSHHVIELFATWRRPLTFARICYSDTEYPHSVTRLLPRNDPTGLVTMQAELRAAVLRKADFVLQPLLTYRAAGAVLHRDDVTLIEAVDGAPNTLLRDGYLGRRTVVTHGRIATRTFVQPFAWYWQEGEWRQRAPATVARLPIARLVRAARALHGAVLEWGLTDRGLIFLEHKILPRHAYPQLASGQEAPLATTPTSIQRDARTVVRPALRHLPILRSEGALRVRTGAYLSHLATYAARENLAVLFVRQ